MAKNTTINLKQMRDCIAEHSRTSKPIIIDTANNTIVSPRGEARCYIEEVRGKLFGKKYRMWFIGDREASPLYPENLLAILDEAIEKHGNQDAVFLWAPNGNPERYLCLRHSSNPAFQTNPYQHNAFHIDGTAYFGNLDQAEANDLRSRWSIAFGSR